MKTWKQVISCCLAFLLLLGTLQPAAAFAAEEKAEIELTEEGADEGELLQQLLENGENTTVPQTSFQAYALATGEACIDPAVLDTEVPKGSVLFSNGAVLPLELTPMELGLEYAVEYDADADAVISCVPTERSAWIEELTPNIELVSNKASADGAGKYTLSFGGRSCSMDEGFSSMLTVWGNTSELRQFAAVDEFYEALADGTLLGLLRGIDKDGDGDIDYLILSRYQYAKITDVVTDEAAQKTYVAAEDVSGNALSLNGSSQFCLETDVITDRQPQVGDVVKASWDFSLTKCRFQTLPRVENAVFQKRVSSYGILKYVILNDDDYYEVAENGWAQQTKNILSSSHLGAAVNVVVDGEWIVMAEPSSVNNTDIAEINEQLVMITGLQIDKYTVGGDRAYIDYMTIDGEEHEGVRLSTDSESGVSVVTADALAAALTANKRLFVLRKKYDQIYLIALTADNAQSILFYPSSLLDGYKEADVGTLDTVDNRYDVDGVNSANLFFVAYKNSSGATRFAVMSLDDMGGGTDDAALMQGFYKQNGTVRTYQAGYFYLPNLVLKQNTGYLFSATGDVWNYGSRDYLEDVFFSDGTAADEICIADPEVYANCLYSYTYDKVNGEKRYTLTPVVTADAVDHDRTILDYFDDAVLVGNGDQKEEIVLEKEVIAASRFVFDFDDTAPEGALTLTEEAGSFISLDGLRELIEQRDEFAVDYNDYIDYIYRPDELFYAIVYQVGEGGSSAEKPTRAELFQMAFGYLLEEPTEPESSIRWTLENGILTLTGSGPMDEYQNQTAPWKSQKDAIRSIHIGEGITTVSSGAFSGCTSLTEITIPASVTAIGDEAFSFCENLTSVTFAENSQLESIGNYAFYGCSSLTEITIPESVTAIRDWAFSDCTSLTEIAVAEGNTVFVSVDGVLYNRERTILCAYPGGKAAERFLIPETVTMIQNGAFKGCSSLKEITIPASFTSISYGAFSGCSSLTKITLPESVITIGNSAFSGCTSLMEITIPESVTTIGDSAFYGCSSLTKITIPAGVTTIGKGAFSGCRSLKEITIPTGVTSIGDHAFSDCRSLTEITIPKSVTTIGAGAFSGCTSLTEITLPEGVASIYGWVFYGCSSLKEITIPAGVTSIGARAFSGCTSLTGITVAEENGAYTAVDGVLYDKPVQKLLAYPAGKAETAFTLPDAVTSVVDYAFEACNGLKKIIFPEALEKIGMVSGSGFSQSIQLEFLGNAPECTGSGLAYGNTRNICIHYHKDKTGWEQAPWTNYVRLCVEENMGEAVQLEANNYDSQGLYYSLYSSTGEAGAIRRYAVVARCVDSPEAVVIPEKVRDRNGAIYTVTEIGRKGKSVFSSRSNLTEITIPASVATIGEGAFSSCESLTSVTFAENSQLESIGDYAFSECSSLTKITIPASVTAIGDEAFSFCENLTSVTFAENSQLESIGNYAFSECSSLTEITISASVTAIGDEAFSFCENLTSITFAENSQLEAIGDYAFSGCSSLTEITIPDGVASIGDKVFKNCTSLAAITVAEGNTAFTAVDGVLYDKAMTTLYVYPAARTAERFALPATVTAIAQNAFSSAHQLKRIDITDLSAWCRIRFDGYLANPCYAGKAELYCNGALVQQLVVPADIPVLTATFAGCSSLTSVDFAEGSQVSAIGDYTFCNCKNLREIRLPEGIEAIGSFAFWNCDGLKEIGLPESLKTLGYRALCNCDGLTEISIPANTALSDRRQAFIYCSNLKAIHVAENNRELTAVDGVLYDKKLQTLYCYPAAKGDGFFTVPASVTAIEPYAFQQAWSLNTVSFAQGSGLTELGNNAFLNCYNLKEITLPGKLEQIGKSAFEYCTSLTEITIPASVKQIGSGAFCGCRRLTTVTFKGVGVPELGRGVFEDCVSLEKITPEFTIDSGSCGSGLLYTLSSGGTLTITGAGAMRNYGGSSKYSEAPWSGSIVKTVILPEGLTAIGNGAFSDCTSLTEITLPESLTSIGDSAFSGCSSLKEITIPAGVTSIGDGVFSGCSSLTEITIPEGVTSIGDWAFSDCTSLTEITLPESLTGIGDSAFSGCSSLKEITIPAGVTSIGDGVFSDCTSLTAITVAEGNTAFTSVDGVLYDKAMTTLYVYPAARTAERFAIPKTVTTISDHAFSDCSSLTEITIPESVTAIGDRAFSCCSSLKEITLPESVTTIGSRAFSDCTGLKKLTLPTGIRRIVGRGFHGIFGSAAKETLFVDAISGCKSLSYLEFLGDAPQYEAEGRLIEEEAAVPLHILYHKGTSGWEKAKWADHEMICVEDSPIFVRTEQTADGLSFQAENLGFDDAQPLQLIAAFYDPATGRQQMTVVAETVIAGALEKLTLIAHGQDKSAHWKLFVLDAQTHAPLCVPYQN